MQPRSSPAWAAGLRDVDVQVLRQCVGRGQLQGAPNNALCLLGTGAHAAILLQTGWRRWSQAPTIIGLACLTWGAHAAAILRALREAWQLLAT